MTTNFVTTNNVSVMETAMPNNLMTDDQAKQWLNTFGNGKTFEKIFECSEMKIKDDKYAIKIIDNIVFMKIKVRFYDVFGSTAQYDTVERYIITPL